MCGADSHNENPFTTVRLEEFAPANHPLRPIRTWVNDALADKNAKLSVTYEAESWWRITPSVLASRARCVARIADLEQRAAQLAGKLDAQDAGAAYRGGKFSDSRARVRFYHEIPPRQNSCRPDRNR